MIQKFLLKNNGKCDNKQVLHFKDSNISNKIKNKALQKKKF